jgi:Cellulase (glycosyl hydrolase family 5)
MNRRRLARTRAAAALVVALGALLLGCGVSAAASAPDLRVRGNELVDGPGRGHVVQLRGVNRSGLEYACIQGWGFFDSPHPDRVDDPAMIAAMLSWDIDVVRVPLNEDCWLGLGGTAATGRGGAPYRKIVTAYVRALNAAHLYVILDLHWAAPGQTKATQQLPMADADHAPAFWRSVAATFRRNHTLLFDLYNEPYGIGWGCWLHGCQIPATGGAPAYRAAGMQALVNAVRSVGATQPLLLGGLKYSGDLSGWTAHAPHDPSHQLVAAEHNYGTLSPCTAGCLSAILATHRGHPVVFGELGETDCAQGYIDQMMRFADAHGIGYLGWSWNATSPGGPTCAGGPSLISSYNGTPTPFGYGLRNHLRKLGPARRPALP